MNFAFFISDHGFGHIMRNLPVLKEVIARKHTVVLVCAERQLRIAAEHLGETASLVLIPHQMEVGLVVQPGTLGVDQKKTAKAVEAYVSDFPNRIAFAKRVLQEHHITRVVVDIVPWALAAANESRTPSYLMASFTWIEQYESYIDEKYLKVLRNAFLSTNFVLLYRLV